MLDEYADRLGLSLTRGDLEKLDTEQRTRLAETMPGHSNMFADSTIFRQWLESSNEDFFEDEHLSSAEDALLDIYHPDVTSEAFGDILHTYIQDTGDVWRLSEDQGRHKLTLFDPLNTKCLQTPREDDLEDRFLAQAVVDHNSKWMESEFEGQDIRIPRITSRGVAELEGNIIPYDITRYESCISFDRIEDEYGQDKVDEIRDRAYRASEIMAQLINDCEVLFVSENEFWKHGKPDNGAYHPETDQWVLWDRGEYTTPINSYTKEDFIDRHDIDEEANKMMERYGVNL